MKIEISTVEFAVAISAAARVVERVPTALRYWLGESVSMVLSLKDLSTVSLDSVQPDGSLDGAKRYEALEILSRIADEEQVRIVTALCNAAFPDFGERLGYIPIKDPASDSPFMSRDPDPECASLGISRGIAETLIAECKKHIGEADPLRHRMFCGRIVAAEHGRQDAVDWAIEWYEALVKEKIELSFSGRPSKDKPTCTAVTSHSPFLVGRIGNKRMQLFVDTLDDVSAVSNNVPYMNWINANYGLFRQQHPREKFESRAEWDRLFTAFLTSVRDRDLAKRLRHQDASSSSD